MLCSVRPATGRDVCPGDSRRPLPREKRRWSFGLRAGVLSVVTAVAMAGLTIGLGTGPAMAAGGVNTGQPGSTCVPTDGGLAYTASGDPGVSTTALGNAPAYYEVGAPTGVFLGKPPLGVMILINGGGWYVVGPGAVAADRPPADQWRSRGWETVNVTYRGCAQSLTDVLWFHDAARSMLSSTLPLCAWGSSAGAQLALMLANRRSDVACVIGEGAPTDFATISTETAYNPATGAVDQLSGGVWVYNLAAAAFGAGQLSAMSPTSHPSHARLLLATAAQDEFVPWGQAQDMARRVQAVHPGTYVDTDQLAAGPLAFTHAGPSQGTGVSQAALNDYYARQLQLVAPLVPQPPTAPTNVTATPGDGTASLAWTPPTGAITSYSITAYDTAGGAVAQSPGCGVTCTGYTFTGLTNGHSYAFVVYAINSAGWSPGGTSPVITPTAA